MNKHALSFTLLAGLALSGAAQAALHDRGGGLIYDDVLDVTWLQDANYAQTSGYDNDGMMTWDQAMSWAANLSYYDSVRNVVYTDWRLPMMVDTGTAGCNKANSGTDCGYNVQTVSGGTVFSELAYMYYVNFGNKGLYDPAGGLQAGSGLVDDPANANDESLFLMPPGMYWFGTEYVLTPYQAWNMHMFWGEQGVGDKSPVTATAWAVRPGDVAAVPEPETYAMLLAGLALVGWRGRQRRLD